VAGMSRAWLGLLVFVVIIGAVYISPPSAAETRIVGQSGMHQASPSTHHLDRIDRGLTMEQAEYLPAGTEGCVGEGI
jgi:hypothetical protein